MSGATPPPPPPQIVPAVGIPSAAQRHVSPVAGSSMVNRWTGLGLIALAGTAAIAFIVTRSPSGVRERDRASDDTLRIRQWVQFQRPPAPPPVHPAVVPNPFTQASLPAVTAPVLVRPPSPPAPTTDPLGAARKAPILAYASNTGNEGASGTGAAGGAGASTNRGGVTKLTATPLAAVTASRLEDRPFLLTRGTQFPCTLETALDSTLSGQVTCRTADEVLGKTGITLLDRHTKIIGRYQSNMQQGQARIFVLWETAETPEGVRIDLNSPATDTLGRAGFDGVVDTHFWERLSGALLLSVVQGGIQAGIAAVSPPGGTNINLGQTESVISDAFRNSIGIRPTLRKNQGEIVSVQLAQDLSFRTVYDIRLTNGAGR